MKNIKNEIINDNEFDLICEYIKLRNESNISQSELSRRVGIARSTVARMEKIYIQYHLELLLSC